VLPDTDFTGATTVDTATIDALFYPYKRREMLPLHLALSDFHHHLLMSYTSRLPVEFRINASIIDLHCFLTAAHLSDMRSIN